jgi:hypothetical protein
MLGRDVILDALGQQQHLRAVDASDVIHG